MKKNIAFILLLMVSTSFGQTYIKFNGVSALVGVPNVGIETSIGKKTTFSFDVMASFWKSFAGHNPMQFYTFTSEVRYHFKEKYKGWYFGAHVGPDIYRLQKWNYWNTRHYEEGFGYRIGATLGYNFKISEKLNLEAFLGGGWHQGFYRGYYNDGTPGRYEKAEKFNKSGEWLPYRGGLMITYKLD